MGTTPSTMTDTLYCTIDTSRMGEEDKGKVYPGSIRKADGQANWRCAAVIKDARNGERIRVACRDEAELRKVKEAAQKTVLRDQLYPVKVNNANRAAILGREGKVLPGAAEVLGKENEVSIAKIAWLSRRDQGKAYGSMVVYVTKGSEAVRLLHPRCWRVCVHRGLRTPCRTNAMLQLSRYRTQGIHLHEEAGMCKMRGRPWL
jgi:hypothetical protein